MTSGASGASTSSPSRPTRPSQIVTGEAAQDGDPGGGARGDRREPSSRIAPMPGDPWRRLTWLLVMRLVVITLLLVAAVTVDLVGGVEREGAWTAFAFGLIAVTYGLTLLFALLLRRGVDPLSLATLQIACDAVAAGMLIHADGSAESGFVVLYLMVIVGGTLVLPSRAAAISFALVTLSYVAIVVLDHLHVLPSWPSDAAAIAPAGLFPVTVGKNLVFFAAAFALSHRLANDLQRAGQDLAEQGLLLGDLAALHADVVRSMTSGLITLSDEGIIRSINPMGEEILGVGASQLIGRSLSERLPELAAFVAALGNTKARGEVSIERSDGEARVVGLSVAQLVAASGSAKGRMINFQDLSELHRMQQRIERTERLAAIGRLAAGIAHEIRNPLAAISGSIELLTPSIASDEESRDLIGIVTREVDRLNRLITELLDFARPRPPQVTPLEIGRTLREILRVVENDRRLNPIANRFGLHMPDELWVDADPAQLRQVVLNLLLNAADASPGGEPIDLVASIEGRHALIEVRDGGPGIPQELRGRIFEPFFSTKKGGTGLGLATVHRIVEEHGGTIEVGQASTGGAVFTIRLPLREPVEG